jgi:hypothetical protein
MANSDDARTLRPLQAAACTYRIAFGPRVGQKLLTVQGAMQREPSFEQELCADMQGFSLHAALRSEPNDRQGLERLCRYITRPPLSSSAEMSLTGNPPCPVPSNFAPPLSSRVKRNCSAVLKNCRLNTTVWGGALRPVQSRIQHDARHVANQVLAPAVSRSYRGKRHAAIGVLGLEVGIPPKTPRSQAVFF